MIFEFGGEKFILLFVRCKSRLRVIRTSADDLPRLDLPALCAIQMRDEILEGMPGGPKLEKRAAESVARGGAA